MSVPPIDLGGLRIWAPVTAGSNLLLAVQCGWYWARLRGAGAGRARSWGQFFLWIGVATAVGAVKHALRPDLGPVMLTVVHWGSSLAAGLGVWWAQGASPSVNRGTPPGWLERVRTPQLLLYLLANVVMGPFVILMVANTAVGLLPVIVDELGRARVGCEDGKYIAGGLTFSLLPAVVYALQLSPAPWLTHVDVAHGLMAVGNALVFQGAGTPSRAPDRRGRPASVALP